MNKKYLFVLLAIVISCSVFFLIKNYNSSNQEIYYKEIIKNDIRVSFTSDKSKYKVDEEFIITYELKNVSFTKKTIHYSDSYTYHYKFLTTEPDNIHEYYDTTIVNSYKNYGYLGNGDFVLKPRQSLKLSIKYSPKKNNGSKNIEKIIFLSDFEGGNFKDLNLSFPIIIEN